MTHLQRPHVLIRVSRHDADSDQLGTSQTELCTRRPSLASPPLPSPSDKEGASERCAMNHRPWNLTRPTPDMTSFQNDSPQLRKCMDVSMRVSRLHMLRESAACAHTYAAGSTIAGHGVSSDNFSCTWCMLSSLDHMSCVGDEGVVG